MITNSSSIAIAQEVKFSGDVPVGALIVNEAGEIVSFGKNEREKDNDPTAHAEILAIKRACLLYTSPSPRD